MNDTAEILNKITANAEEIDDFVKEISTGSNEQRTSIEAMTKALSQVNQIVQQNSSIAAQTASTSEDLSTRSTQLQATIGQFRLKEQNIITISQTEKSSAEKLKLSLVQGTQHQRSLNLSQVN